MAKRKIKNFFSTAGWIMGGIFSISCLIGIILSPFGIYKSNGYFSHGFFHTMASVFQTKFVVILKYTVLGACLIFLIGGLVSLFGLKAVSPVPGKLIRSRWYRFPVAVLFIVLLIIQFAAFLPRIKPGPNVVVIVVDTLRSDHTAVSSGSDRLTPRLKSQLMADGIPFPNAFSNSNWTLPSVASLMTSRYPSDIDVTQLTSVLGDRHITLAEILKEKGYRTGGVVSHMLVSRSYGLAQGFDHYNEDNIADEYGNHHAISSPGVTDQAVKFIRNNRGKKFFLFLHYFDPHYIYINHERSTGYSGPFTSGDFRKLRNLVRDGKYTPEDLAYLRTCYESEIKFTDLYIGKVLNELKQQNLYENTIVIFTSDHGEEFLEHQWLGHSTHLYNEQIHVPLVIKPVKNGSRSLPAVDNRVVSNLDIIPTLMNMLGIVQSLTFQGRDIFSMPSEGGTVFSEVTQDQFKEPIDEVCVITDEWKLIRDFVENNLYLFHRIMDPAEKNNRIHEKASVEMHLKMEIAKWIKDHRQLRKARSRKKLSPEEIRRLENLGYL